MNTQLCPTVCFPGKGKAGNQSPPRPQSLTPLSGKARAAGSPLGLIMEQEAREDWFVVHSSVKAKMPRNPDWEGPGAEPDPWGPPPSTSTNRKLALLAVSCSDREWLEFPRAMWEQSVSARPGQGTPPQPHRGGPCHSADEGGCLVPRLVSMGAPQGWAGPRPL